jgi:hypothetical protein
MMDEVAFEELLNKLRVYIVGRFTENLNLLINAYPQTKDRYDTVLISDHSLMVAIDEIIRDFRFMKLRRPDSTVLSAGKMAGIIVFRLSRWPIIGTSDKLLHSGDTFGKFTFLAATFTGLDFINKNFSQIDEMCRTELLYTLMRRHVNQETLGLVFDYIHKT